ncbi:hypothetical protein MXD81_15380, partial [Microbacteriaceae bacterium K1510]|nr:hypothetical protein [Microbacteriaceae bacterium K1510]
QYGRPLFILRVIAPALRDIHVGSRLTDERIHSGLARVIEVQVGHHRRCHLIAGEAAHVHDPPVPVKLVGEKTRHVIEGRLLSRDTQLCGSCAETPIVQASIKIT